MNSPVWYHILRTQHYFVFEYFFKVYHSSFYQTNASVLQLYEGNTNNNTKEDTNIALEFLLWVLFPGRKQPLPLIQISNSGSTARCS